MQISEARRLPKKLHGLGVVDPYVKVHIVPMATGSGHRIDCEREYPYRQRSPENLRTST